MPLNTVVLIGLMLAAAGDHSGHIEVRSVTVEQQVIMRVPVRPRTAPWLEWRERKGPTCIGTRDLAGATLSGPSSIDFVYRNRGRYRARLDSSCEALDFYSGFYLQPDGGQVCAGRDVIRSRMGGVCRIEQFLTLHPRTKRSHR
jgi:hypothetical protein